MKKEKEKNKRSHYVFSKNDLGSCLFLMYCFVKINIRNYGPCGLKESKMYLTVEMFSLHRLGTSRQF